MSSTRQGCSGTAQLRVCRHRRSAILWVLAGYVILTGAGLALAQPNEPAAAPPQVILWGVQRGCDVDVAAARTLISRLESFAGRPVLRVGPPADSPHLNCVGAQCAQLLRNACPALTGQLIGAEIDEVTTFEGRTPELVARLRVWRQDLSGKQSYYLYGLCPHGVCGHLSVPEKLAEMASHIIERQPFEEDARSIEEVLASRLPLCAMQPPGALAHQLIASQTDLCRPFPAPRCPSAEVAHVMVSAPVRSSGGPAGLPRSLVRGTQGALWGLFGASAASAVTLFVLNSSDAGTAVSAGYNVQGSLLRPAWTAAAFSLLALAVAIPTTTFLGRAAKKVTLPEHPVEVRLQAGVLRCPE